MILSILSGTLRGRKIEAPQGLQTRPTQSRTREALFNILSHRFFSEGWNDLSVLDLFAGTGALGFEALSRGARDLTSLEKTPDTFSVLQKNALRLNLLPQTRLIKEDVLSFRFPTTPSYHLAFCDPPYGCGLGIKSLHLLAQSGCLHADALCVLEEAADMPFDSPKAFSLEEKRIYGKTQLIFLRYLP